MISPEMLRRYPFFGFLTDTERKAIAMVSEEVAFENGSEIFKTGEKAEWLYFLMWGSATNYFIVETPKGDHKELNAGDINAGELFGISSVLEKNVYTTTMRAGGNAKAIRIDARALRAAFELDNKLGYNFMSAISQALMQRLNAARAQIATVE